MAFRLVRNDITKMKADIIVNTANTRPVVGPGCDRAIYEAAGFEQLLEARKKIGDIPTGEVAVTPAFGLDAKYIIHAVSPLFFDGNENEEQLLRNCYRNSLYMAAELSAKSIAFPLIATGSFGYPKEEGLRVALDEINAFLVHNSMEVYVVVFDEKSTSLGTRIYPGLESYIDRHYVENKYDKEYPRQSVGSQRSVPSAGAKSEINKDNFINRISAPSASNVQTQALFNKSESIEGKPQKPQSSRSGRRGRLASFFGSSANKKGNINTTECSFSEMSSAEDYNQNVIDFETQLPMESEAKSETARIEPLQQAPVFVFDEQHEKALADRMKHASDSFADYLLYLIENRGMKNSDVYKAALVNKKTFSKIKNNPDYHPNKMTAMCLCVGAKLNLDETKDLLARAGYALSPCDKTDIIFSFFIEQKVYDIFEIDIQLEEHGLPALVDEDF